MKTRIVTLSILMAMSFSVLRAQNKASIAIISMDTKDLTLDNVALASLVRLELEKTEVYEVKDKYDVSYTIEEHDIDVNQCFGKNRLIEVGKILEADKMLTGSAEKFGDKIIFILRLIDVQSERIEKTSVVEYLDQQEEIQYMVQISIHKLLDLEADETMVDLLVNYDRPITSPKTKVKLNGPRMGATCTFGPVSHRLQAPKEEGGFNAFPVTSMFGYQYEVQYLSSGEFQALIEFIGALNGLESGTVIPSLTFLNGFRFNNSGWEIGVGPTFRTTQKAKGFYDNEGKWNLSDEMTDEQAYPLQTEIDSRGTVELSTGLIVAVGKTFRSGYLNVPVNLYVSPRKEGTVVGLTFGFNVAKKPRL